MSVEFRQKNCCGRAKKRSDRRPSDGLTVIRSTTSKKGSDSFEVVVGAVSVSQAGNRDKNHYQSHGRRFLSLGEASHQNWMLGTIIPRR